MGNIHHIIDNLNEQFIVVTMENSSYELDFMKMYERIEMVEDNIINYIIPYIEKNYNVSKKASDRAFCGISMGAMITTYMYFDYPEYFGYFGCIFRI